MKRKQEKVQQTEWNHGLEVGPSVLEHEEHHKERNGDEQEGNRKEGSENILEHSCGGGSFGAGRCRLFDQESDCHADLNDGEEHDIAPEDHLEAAVSASRAVTLAVEGLQQMCKRNAASSEEEQASSIAQYVPVQIFQQSHTPQHPPAEQHQQLVLHRLHTRTQASEHHQAT